MKIVGIDPGLKGALAFYDGTELRVYPIPLITEEFIKKGKKAKRQKMDLERASAIIAQEQPDVGLLEKVTARTGQGVTSMFRFGANYGEYRGILTGLRVPFVEVTPQVWKNAYDLTSDKNPSLDLAKQLWPDMTKEYFRLKKHDGNAEAALIAKFGFDNPSLFE